MRVASPEAIARLLLARLDERGERHRPVTLGQLVGELLPYERVRPALGLAGKAEYDLSMLALLRAREYLMVDPALSEAVEEALRAPEPELAALDELSEALVKLRDGGRPIERGDPVRRDREEDAPGDAFDESEPPAARELHRPADRKPDRPVAGPSRPAAGEPPRRDAPKTPPRRTGDAHASASPRATPAGPTPARERERCSECGRPRPDRAGARFCPFCGADQTERRCADCGETLEPAWSYCPVCGRAVEDSGGESA